MLKHCLVLGSQDFGENSFVITILQPQLGKQMFLAKGGKHIGAKLTPSLVPLNLVHLWLAPGRGRYLTIQETKVCASYIPRDYTPLKFSLRIADLLGRVTYPGLECREFMRDTLRTLILMRDRSGSPDDVVRLWIRFEELTLVYLGIAPDKTKVRASSLSALSVQLERMILQGLPV